LYTCIMCTNKLSDNLFSHFEDCLVYDLLDIELGGRVVCLLAWASSLWFAWGWAGWSSGLFTGVSCWLLQQQSGDDEVMLSRDEIQRSVAAANDDMDTNLSRMTDW